MKAVVVNGQGLNINHSGGAGRYCGQLYKRLADPENVDLLDGINLHLPNFCNEKFTAALDKSPARLTSDRIKSLIYRSCPPFIFEWLQHGYQRAKSTTNTNYHPTQKKVNKIPSWYELHKRTSKTLFHELTNYSMLYETGRLSLSSKYLLLVTFLDIQDFYFPEYFLDDDLRSRRLIYSFYKDRADFFFAISEFTKSTMVDRLSIEPEKIKVIHLAADDLVLLKPSNDVIEWVNTFGRFWIYPAKAWKHKNHEFLLRALGKRCQELKRKGLKILLTGGFNKIENDYLNKLILENSLVDVVMNLGFVSDEQLQALLRYAEYLVFPSLYEGFGMPVLEAMSLGCPVISSNAGSLPEVGGDAAVYFDPNREDEFVGLIDSMLSSTGIERDALIKKGFENCRRFSWDKTYTETINVYKDLLD